MWILCLAEDSLETSSLAEDSLETSSLIFSEKQWKNIYECRLLHFLIIIMFLVYVRSFIHSIGDQPFWPIWLRGYYFFMLNSAENFFLLINVRMPTTISILTFCEQAKIAF